jgi:hypothetical protein
MSPCTTLKKYLPTVTLPEEMQEGTEDVKAAVLPDENGNGAMKEEVKYEQSEDTEAKPAPEKKRKISEDKKGQEAHGSKKEKRAQDPKAEKAQLKAEGKQDEKVTKPKVKYDMPGQTQPTPNAGDPLAKFYTSLREQRPESEIAPKW